MDNEIKLLITDFDGTLVDTFEANYNAYNKAFESVGYSLSRSDYRKCFGMRFDSFMGSIGVSDSGDREKIKDLKAEFYPDYFNFLKLNRPLVEFIRLFHKQGGKTAIASTARGKNLNNVLEHFGLKADFDLILAGEHVKEGKPNPEIYNTVLSITEVKPENALVFEDSEIGCKAAAAAGIAFIKVKQF